LPWERYLMIRERFGSSWKHHIIFYVLNLMELFFYLFRKSIEEGTLSYVIKHWFENVAKAQLF